MLPPQLSCSTLQQPLPLSLPLMPAGNSAVRCLNISLDGSKTLPATKWQRCLLLISIATSAAAAASAAEAR